MRMPGAGESIGGYLPWMSLLAGLFTLRVLAQLLQATYPVGFLPAFESWQGSSLPYPALVVSQVAIIAAMASVIRSVSMGGIRPVRWRYRVCFAAGSAYLAVMTFRLAAGLTFLAEVPWFSQSIPAFFHIVLALFILLLGHYLYRKSASLGQRSGGLAVGTGERHG